MLSLNFSHIQDIQRTNKQRKAVVPKSRQCRSGCAGFVVCWLVSVLTGVCLVWALMVSAYIARSTVLSHWAKTTKRFCPTTADPFWVCNEGGGGISGTHTKHKQSCDKLIEPLEWKQRHRKSSASIVFAMAFQGSRIRYATFKKKKHLCIKMTC